MNSYPVELLAQPLPVMFVAGLEPAPAISPVVSPRSPPVPLTGTSPHSSPSPGFAHRVQTSNAQHDPFVILQQRLRDALTQVPKNTIWLADRGRTFQVLLVEKNVRFPPRKIFPPTPANRIEETLSATATARSPLSPLMPSSPLHPDGLIAPIWMRKHLELVPSVFVLFLRLWELPAPTSPLEGHNAQDREEERRHDMELANEIASRKKSAAERGIKLTCVLLASRRMLDDPNLDPRLTFIRRQSALDSRAALFVLSPVSASELNEFVRSLQDALYESASEYYSNHSKRVRRKRNRHVNASNPPPAFATANPRPQPLRPIGWSVRYDYKLATFAEFRSEEEVARKHYEDCWSQLLDMFSSTGVLPPRTKRWAEAKVLADCIAVKIVKLYLYSGEHARALSHLNRHVTRFGELSRAWGIGEDMFEYWSWQARQQRVLAELLEAGIRAGFKLPSHLPSEPVNPALTAQLAVVGGHGRGTSVDLSAVFGLAPSSALQHPGFYYFAAAQFTQRRYTEFLRALDLEATAPSALSASPGFMNEKKVDHQALILELHTKAYDLFKKYSPSSLRLTLYVAYHIGLAYHAAAKYDTAAKFFERIAKTYRKESWGKLLHPISRTWFASVRQLPDAVPAVRLLFEMMSLGVSPDPSGSPSAAQELVDLLKSSSPDKDESITLDATDTLPLGTWRSVFWSATSVIDQPAPFQLHLQARPDVPFDLLPVDALLLFFSGNEKPSVVVQHQPSDTGNKVVDVDLGSYKLDDQDEPVTVDADLRVPSGPGRVVLRGTISRATPGKLEITKAILCLKEGNWMVEMPLEFNKTGVSSTASQLQWFSSPENQSQSVVTVIRPKSHMTIVNYPPHAITVALTHASPAYLDEVYPITVSVSNDDTRPLSVTVDVLLQPMEHDAEDEIALGDQRSSTLLKGVQLGTLEPGDNVQRKIELFCTRAPGDRVLDVSVQSRSPSAPAASSTSLSASLDTNDAPSSNATPEPEASAEADTDDVNEDLHTLVVPTVAPLEYDWDVQYHRPPTGQGGALEPGRMELYDPEAFESDATAVVVLACVAPGPWDVEVEAVRLDRTSFGGHRVLSCSADEDEFPLVLSAGDAYSATVTVALSKYTSLTPGDEPQGEMTIAWHRSSSTDTPSPSPVSSSSTILLPPLHIPSDTTLLAFLNPPTTCRLHTPISLTLTIQNHHPSRTSDLSLVLEPNENFVVAGPRAARLPLLLCGAQDEFEFVLVPLVCGPAVRLPVVRLYDNRTTKAQVGAEGDPYAGMPGEGGAAGQGQEVVKAEVEVRDARADIRMEDGTVVVQPGGEMTVVVVP